MQRPYRSSPRPQPSCSACTPWTLSTLGNGWTAAPDLGQAVSQALGAYAALQAILFALTAFFVAIPPIRRALTPRFLKRHRVKRTAYAHFASTGLSHVETRTGVLIFASLDDKQVELVADEAIHREVGDIAWGRRGGGLGQRG